MCKIEKKNLTIIFIYYYYENSSLKILSIIFFSKNQREIRSIYLYPYCSKLLNGG